MDVEVLEDGCIMLVPIVKIPRHQMWAWGERFDRQLAEASLDRTPKASISTPGMMDTLAKDLGISI